jgi:hypothetical protein
LSLPALETGVATVALAENKGISAAAAITRHSTVRIALLTVFVLFVHGYHPFSDDAGGIYVAGIEKMMHPNLFGADAGFILAHTRLSIFSHIFAEVLNLLHLPLEVGLFLSYLLTAFAFLYGCLRVSQRIFHDDTRAWGATLLAAALFTLPTAATALSIMDPDPTARSFSTPLSLFTLAACMDRRWTQAIVLFLITAAMHPLMAAHLACFLVVYIIVSMQRWRLLAATCIAGFAACALIYLKDRHTPVPDGYVLSMLMPEHGYFFLSRWHWYERIGIIAPLLLMLVAAFRTRRGSTISNVCITSIAVGATAILASACFVHTDGSYFLARIQLLRTFQVIYAVGVLLLGGFFAKYLSGRRVPLGALLLLLVSGLMLFVQKQVYTTSAHVEWPFAAPKNPWEQAFVWIRLHTPQDAVFAADPSYPDAGTEDAQGFRTISERSILMDGLKDEGAVTMFPELAPQWKRGYDLEHNLDHLSDEERVRRLKPAGVTWLLLASNATTQFDCPYRNAAVSVCRLP